MLLLFIFPNFSDFFKFELPVYIGATVLFLLSKELLCELEKAQNQRFSRIKCLSKTRF